MEHDGPVATVSLNRPSKRNAVNWTMWRELPATLRRLATQEDLRIVVLTGTGGSFCSGADLGSSLPDIHPYLQMEEINSVVETLHHLPKVTIARVDGDAVGAGANLAFACDMSFASRPSRFSEIFVRRGMSDRLRRFVDDSETDRSPQGDGVVPYRLHDHGRGC